MKLSALLAAALVGALPLGAVTPATPSALPGAEAYVYRLLTPVPLRLFVFKPAAWRTDGRRPALVWFFGGGWATGTAANAAAWARWAAALGWVGVAPDYRVKDRFGTTPLESVADARAALHWVQVHAAELGVDPQRIVVGGNSAGGHLALWTAITAAPPGSAPGESPRAKPAALILTSPVSDTSPETGYTPQRFGTDARALSPVHQLDPAMPPVLVFHGDADRTVPYRESVALRDRLVATGNRCELITVPGGSHNYAGDLKPWWPRTQAIARDFLARQGLLPK